MIWSGVCEISSNKNRIRYTKLITSADKVGEIMFSVAFVCVFVCSCVCGFVCPDDNSKSIIAICIKLSGGYVTMPE